MTLLDFYIAFAFFVSSAMNCFFCAKTAVGICKFCGRGLCTDHTQFGAFVLEVSRSEQRDRTEALVVEDALQCGTCKPQPQPVPMPELD